MASIQLLSPEETIELFVWSLIVRSEEAMTQLCSEEKSLILIPMFEDKRGIARAARSGHRVVTPLGNADSQSDSDIEIPRLSRQDAAKSLMAVGLSEGRSEELAAVARRGLMSFRRLIALSPADQQPAWARPENGRAILPAFLMGEWEAGREGDREAIAELVQTTYEQFDSTLARWANEADPPVRRIGDAWYLVSKEDSGTLTLKYLDRDYLERFQKTCLRVLGVADPLIDKSADERLAGSLFGKSPRYSERIKQGLADTLAFFGARDHAIGYAGDTSGPDYATKIVSSLLKIANADWKIWANISPLLPLLAEAAPDAFLAAADQGLQGESPILLKLFSEQEDILFGNALYPSLLWALETIAWDPARLSYVALALAKLSRLDPGGKLTNRPKRSLHEIFLPWHPQTTASLEKRLAALDLIREREPDVAWQLLTGLLPEHQGIGEYTARPRWRDWCPEKSVTVTYGEYYKAISEIVSRIVADASNNAARWEHLVKSLTQLPGEQYETVVIRLETIDLESLDINVRDCIWSALRYEISQSRIFSDATWALPPDKLGRLELIQKRFEPADVCTRLKWLFTDSPLYLAGRSGNIESQMQATANAYEAAVREVFENGGLARVMDFVLQVGNPRNVGLALEMSGLTQGMEDSILYQYLDSDNTAYSSFAWGYLRGCVSRQGTLWLQGRISGTIGTFSLAQKVKLLFFMPWNQTTWDLAERTHPELERLYWGSVVPGSVRDSNDLDQAVCKLLQFCRPTAAIDLLARQLHSKQPPSVSLALQTIEKSLSLPGENQPNSTLVYNVGELLDYLESSSMVDSNRAASLEWAFLPLFRYNQRSPRFLYQQLARDPDFFVEVLAVVFKKEGEKEHPLTDQNNYMITRGGELLNTWRPLIGESNDGDIGVDSLLSWVVEARKRASSIGLGLIADAMIGESLGGSQEGSDGAWPHEAVRAVIEQVQSGDLESGLMTGRYNSRGAHSWRMSEGGAQELAIAKAYEKSSQIVRDRWPRTASMLRAMASNYQRDARWVDQRAELSEDRAD